MTHVTVVNENVFALPKMIQVHKIRQHRPRVWDQPGFTGWAEHYKRQDSLAGTNRKTA